MREKSWWEERIVGAFMSYWIYQHLGNLSPRELEEDDLFQAVREAGDATRVLREFAHRASREDAGSRWSFYRDFGKTRLIVLDSRAGRVLDEDQRSMLDAEEWAWVEDKASGDFDHLLIGTSLPFLLSPGLHHLEAWNEAVCRGAWGRPGGEAGRGHPPGRRPGTLGRLLGQLRRPRGPHRDPSAPASAPKTALPPPSPSSPATSTTATSPR